jgi:adenylate cyclase
MKKYLYIFCLILIVFSAAVYLFIYEVSPFFELSQKTDDINFSLSDNIPDKNIIFAAVDEKSVNRLGRWPWDRSVIAKGLKKIDNASVVLLDMTFSETSSKSEDEALSEAISSMNNVVCGFFLRNSATEVMDTDRKRILSLSSLERIKSENIALPGADFAEVSIEPVLKACALNAAFSTFPDKDGIFRRYPLGFVYDGSVYPTLGIQGLRFYLNSDIAINSDKNSITGKINNKKIVFNKNGIKRLNYYDLDDYKTISFSDILEGKIAGKVFNNKIVIVGITEAGISDIRSTPVGAVPGPLLHYTFISNVLSDHLITENKAHTLYSAALLCFIPFFLSFVMKKNVPRISLNIFCLILFIVTAKILYINSGLWINTFFPACAFIISVFSAEAVLSRFQEKESRFIKQAFSAYVSPVLLKQLAEHPEDLKLGGEDKEITTLFLDIRNFTSISESLKSHELVNMLKELFNPLTKIIQDNHGFVDKYIGDAVMAFYNAPVNIDNHPDMACKSALEMMKFMKSDELKQRVNIGFDLNIGVGINTGFAVVGNTGADNRFNYTAIGDSVNLCARLQDLNKTYHTSILISEFTKKRLSDEFLTRQIEKVTVKGKTQGVMIYELMENTLENIKIKEMFEKSLQSDLAEDFQKCYKATSDPVSKIFAERYL